MYLLLHEVVLVVLVKGELLILDQEQVLEGQFPFVDFIEENGVL